MYVLILFSKYLITLGKSSRKMYPGLKIQKLHHCVTYKSHYK